MAGPCITIHVRTPIPYMYVQATIIFKPVQSLYMELLPHSHNCSVLTTVFTCVGYYLLMMSIMSSLPHKVLCINYCMTCAEGLHFFVY